jgi:hypothetical protein
MGQLVAMLGRQRLYDFMDGNPSIYLAPSANVATAGRVADTLVAPDSINVAIPSENSSEWMRSRVRSEARAWQTRSGTAPMPI